MRANSTLRFDLAPATELPRSAARTRTGGVSGATHDPSLGVVTISSRVAGAEVYVDGEFVGNSPAIVSLPPGKHTVEVRVDGLPPYRRALQVLGGSKLTLRAEFPR